MTGHGYARVSSKAQSLEMQRAAIARLVELHGDAIPLEHWFVEKRSAKTIDRPELQRLRQEVRAGRVRKIYVYRLDRLARTGIRDTFEIIEEFRKHGAEIVSAADGFDLNGPAAEIIIAVMAWAAKMERLAINERISDARIRMEDNGQSWGRKPKADSWVEGEIARLRSEKRTVRSIAMALKVTRGVVERTLKKLSRKHEQKNPPGSPLETAVHQGVSR